MLGSPVRARPEAPDTPNGLVSVERNAGRSGIFGQASVPVIVAKVLFVVLLLQFNTILGFIDQFTGTDTTGNTALVLTWYWTLRCQA